MTTTENDIRTIRLLRYVTEVVELAEGFQEVNAEGDPELDAAPERDDDLDGQIGVIVGRLDAGDIAGAVNAADHLAGMLVISYTDDSDLPDKPA